MSTTSTPVAADALPPASTARAAIARPPAYFLPLLAAGAVLLNWLVVGFSLSWGDLLLASVLPAVAIVGIARFPGASLALMALLVPTNYALGIGAGVGLLIAISVVLFGAAAYGSRATLWISGVGLVAAPIGLFALVVLRTFGLESIDSFLRNFSLSQLPGALSRLLGGLSIVGLTIGALFILLPWLLGLAWRSVIRSRQEAAMAQAERDEAERETAYAREVADLRAGQTQLARDVHDVVGHSLAVILAQAQSAQYLRDDELDKMRETMATVADSARRSLGDVRAVLTGTRDQASAASAGLETLISGVRAAGNEVVERVDGTPRPLSPELAEVAYRVLQEMLTNALKHGREGGPVWVRQIWPEQPGGRLTIEVHNLIDADREAQGAGIGLGSMHDRLASVGGSLRTGAEATADGPMFGAVAVLPLRATEVSGGMPVVPRVAG